MDLPTRIGDEESPSTVIHGESEMVTEVMDLVQGGRVSEARQLLSTVPENLSGTVENWRRVLAEPNAEPGISASGSSLSSDSLWLKENADRYQGRWVALKQGVMLGSHVSRRELHRRLKCAGALNGASFLRV